VISVYMIFFDGCIHLPCISLMLSFWVPLEYVVYSLEISFDDFAVMSENHGGIASRFQSHDCLGMYL